MTVGLTGAMWKSSMRLFALSETIIVCEQNASVTEVVPRIEEISQPPTKPFTSLSGSTTPSGRTLKSEETYTDLKKVANSTTRMSGVMREHEKGLFIFEV